MPYLYAIIAFILSKHKVRENTESLTDLRSGSSFQVPTFESPAGLTNSSYVIIFQETPFLVILETFRRMGHMREGLLESLIIDCHLRINEIEIPIKNHD